MSTIKTNIKFSEFPDWAKKHKGPGVQIHAYSTKNGVKFSLYEVKSKYNPEKEREKDYRQISRYYHRKWITS